jgi:hypothetical protein
MATLSLACLGGCGSDTPTSPPPPAASAEPAGFVVVSGETLQPVAEARVIVGGTEYTTGADGRVSLPAPPGGGALVDILAPGFFDRQTTAGRVQNGRYTVWPRESPTRLTEHATAEIVYTSAGIGEEHVLGASPLRRWAGNVNSVGVVFQGPEVDPAYRPWAPRALAAQEAAIHGINAATGGRPAYAGSQAAAATAGRVNVRIFPDYTTCQEGRYLAVASVPDGEFARTTVTFCSERAAEDVSVAIHELGHTFGLRHSSDRADVMLAVGRNPEAFSTRESLLMGLMLQRPGGNQFPDNDRPARAASAAVVREIVCSR